MSELKELIATRGKFKANLTRFKTYLDKVDESQVDTFNLENRTKEVESLLNKFDDVQTKIEILDSDSNKHEQERYLFEDEYFDYLARAKRLLHNVTMVNSTQSESAQTPSGGLSSKNAKLPPIPLPTFDGSYDQWLYFRDTFTSIVHNDNQISDIQKFHYLRLSLKGEASELLQSLEVSTANYKTAWSMLEKRFENKILLVNNHIRALFNLPTLVKESHTQMRLLHDGLNKHIRALEVLEQPVKYWDGLVVYLIINKLDSITRREWESNTTKQTTFPTIAELSEFLERRCRLLETIKPQGEQRGTGHREKTKSYLATDNSLKCVFCSKPHVIYQCEAFLKLTPEQRFSESKQKKLCINCLKDNHFTKSCKLTFNCKVCKRRHHSLLHFDEARSSNPESTSTENAINQTVAAHVHNLKNQIILSTALVKVQDNVGRYYNCRALLDSGSQSNFITADLATKLNLGRSKIDTSICGVNNSVSKVKFSTSIKVKSNINSFTINITCLILPRITGNLPTTSFDKGSLNIPENIPLADSAFNISNTLDLLIGADTFWQLIRAGHIILGKTKPILQETLLGWIVSGPIPRSQFNTKTYCNLVTNDEVDARLQRFWELEEVAQIKSLSQDDQQAENIFKTTTQRDATGRFIVRLPLKQPVTNLGNSKETALKRFYALENKLNRNDEVREQYVKFMDEYSKLGHMTEVKATDDSISYYIPHHCVHKQSSITTKLRVVFDASCKSTSGVSMNDLQYVGPSIQNDLVSIIMRFRIHKYVLAGDITKMYRQILVHSDDRRLQKILWRSNPLNPIREFELNTVTYGTASAPFLSIRCLQELAYLNEKEYPSSSAIILRDFYVDDLLTGANTLTELRTIYNEIKLILNTGCLSLNKWVSNSSQILHEIANSESNVILNIGNNNETQALGLLWHSQSDVLSYKIQRFQLPQQINKRFVLSVTAQIYDPLGLIGPVVIVAKVFLQKLWQLNIGWDDNLPSNLRNEWRQFHNNLDTVNNLKIPRRVTCDDVIERSIHGFADASHIAYGACVYIRTKNKRGEVITRLICAKSKVAPIKVITIPRLELCAALLLAKLVKMVKAALNIETNYTYLWSDSTVVLSWLQGEPNMWKVFVANRTSQIQNLTSNSLWCHIRTESNPADLISRGTSPSVLANSDLWWHGPEWLKLPREKWPTIQLRNPLQSSEYSKEIRKPKFTVLITACCDDLFNRYSSFNKLQRVVSYILRFKQNALSNIKQYGPITSDELENSQNALLKIAQCQTFSKDIKSLRRCNRVKGDSKLVHLNPFIDEQNILRVGGRLTESKYQFNKKHPAILAGNHLLAHLLAKTEHIRLLHAGPQHLLASLRERFWILSGRNLVRKVLHQCVTCFRVQPKDTNYLMANLPNYRLIPSKPFTNCGVDYCGPFNLRDRKTRNYRISKAYVCLFVCLVTKAIHVELTSDLTSGNFLASLRRFIARRGKVKNMYSDNASTFKGAQAEIYKFVNSIKTDLQSRMYQQGITWHFIPSRAPHMGGIWEAGVKSLKHHLTRVVGNASLTFEEFNTVITQIEACLNSRPISPMSCDPNDPLPLTPGHFLIGQSLVALPEPNVYDINDNRLTRFQKIQKMTQHFWKRWSKEYISELQTRKKWKEQGPHLVKVGAMVVIKEDNLPPIKWSLGRITEVHPGSDNVVRVVTVKTSSGIYKRPVAKVCVLPIQ